MSSYQRKVQESGIQSIQQINEGRKAVGLPLFVIKKRNCLKCDALFNSTGNHNRLCSLCDGYRDRSNQMKNVINSKKGLKY